MSVVLTRRMIAERYVGIFELADEMRMTKRRLDYLVRGGWVEPTHYTYSNLDGSKGTPVERWVKGKSVGSGHRVMWERGSDMHLIALAIARWVEMGMSIESAHALAWNRMYGTELPDVLKPLENVDLGEQ